MGTVYCGPPPGGLSRRSAGIPRPLRGLRLRPPSGGRSTGPGLVTIVSLIIWRMMRIHLDDDEESSSFSSKTIHISYIYYFWHIGTIKPWSGRELVFKKKSALAHLALFNLFLLDSSGLLKIMPWDYLTSLDLDLLKTHPKLMI